MFSRARIKCAPFSSLQARSLLIVAHNYLATTFTSNLHTCHCLAVVAKSFGLHYQAKHSTMGIRHDVEQSLEKYEITHVDGQPKDEDLNLLIKELTNAAGSVATQNGGGEHGHVGMVIDDAEYVTFSKGGTKFVVPTNPGPYPASVDTDKVIRERQLAEHKAECNEYETYLGVENYLRRMIVKAVDHEWLAEIESETMGFNHLSPQALLTHLRSVGGTLDHMDVTELFTNIQKPWDGIEAPAAHFARGDKFERQLLKVGQNKNPTLRLAFALATFHASGEYEPALRDWDAKPKTDQTFANFRIFIQKEFGTQHKQNKTTAKAVGYGIANSITDTDIDQLEAQALMIAELANSMKDESQKQFKEMMELFKATLSKNLPAATNPTKPKMGAAKKKTKCPHCDMEVYHKPDACFELDANAAKRPAGWTSRKNN